MSSGSAQLRISRTKEIPNPTYYVKAIDGEFAEWAFNEERAPQSKGLWRSEIFKQPDDYPLDLEIGTGNGYFFAHRCSQELGRGLVGIELKFKPLIQSIRRARIAGCSNARILRYNAALVEELFAPGEINHVFIHHPDPWEKKAKHKHRLIQDSYLEKLYSLQRPGCFLEFKTDSRDYFDWAMERFSRSTYKTEDVTYDLHKSEFASRNFETHFEKLFLAKGQPIHYALLRV